MKNYFPFSIPNVMLFWYLPVTLTFALSNNKSTLVNDTQEQLGKGGR